MAGQKDSYNASINGITRDVSAAVHARGMVAGRNLTPADINSDAKVAVISEDLARKLGGPAVLGRPAGVYGRSPGSEAAGIRGCGHCAGDCGHLDERPALRGVAAVREGPAGGHGGGADFPAAEGGAAGDPAER